MKNGWIAYIVIMCILCAINGGFIGLLPSTVVWLIIKLIFREKEENREDISDKLTEETTTEALNQKAEIKNDEDANILNEGTNEKQKPE